MSKQSVARLIITGSFLLLLPFTTDSSSATQDKPVEQVSKNIQVLKGMPESQLLPVMHLMRTALGVKCEFCHIAENGKYWMDDKPAKQTARRMIQMVFDINKANFGGETVVTCNSCHRGSTRPVAIPAFGQGAFENTTRTEPGEKVPVPEKLPAVEEILNKYVEAAGGKRALEGIQSRVKEASYTRPKLVNPSGKLSALEVYEKAPNKLLWVTTGPDGTVISQGYNGKVGWIKTPTEQREMTSAEVALVRERAELQRELNFKNLFSSLRVVNKQKIGDRDVYYISGVNLNGKRERLYFDTTTGLLVRRVVLSKTILGLDPVQIDYLDYREVNGVKLPFTLEISYLDSSHYNTTRKFSQIRNNVPVDDAKFEVPSK
jgi:outer membrane lipoprotein-sorting protein